MPEEQADRHEHPQSGMTIVGRKLIPGDIIEREDVYTSTNGKWEKAPCAGCTIQAGGGPMNTWVRPTKQS